MNKDCLVLWFALIDAEAELENANPDVGMGPGLHTLFDRAFQRVGTPLTFVEIKTILNKYKEREQQKQVLSKIGKFKRRLNSGDV